MSADAPQKRRFAPEEEFGELNSLLEPTIGAGEYAPLEAKNFREAV